MKENKKLEANLKAWLTADNTKNENLQKSKNWGYPTVGVPSGVAENIQNRLQRCRRDRVVDINDVHNIESRGSQSDNEGQVSKGCKFSVTSYH